MKVPVTLAVRKLQNAGIVYTNHLYNYEDKGGTTVSARELAVAEHCVIKTLIMEVDRKECIVVLMHGDCQVSTRELARILGVKSIAAASPAVADRHSGYQVGGTSPFGLRRSMRVYMERSISDLGRI